MLLAAVASGQNNSASVLLDAIVENISSPNGPLAALATGHITVDGSDYRFMSGGYGRGYLPLGTYDVTDPTKTSQGGMVLNGVGFKFFLPDKYDPRLAQLKDPRPTRTDLRIHPDGPPPGTSGCIGIEGNATQLNSFYDAVSGKIKSGQKVQVRVSRATNPVRAVAAGLIGSLKTSAFDSVSAGTSESQYIAPQPEDDNSRKLQGLLESIESSDQTEVSDKLLEAWQLTQSALQDSEYAIAAWAELIFKKPLLVLKLVDALPEDQKLRAEMLIVGYKGYAEEAFGPSEALKKLGDLTNAGSVVILDGKPGSSKITLLPKASAEALDRQLIFKNGKVLGIANKDKLESGDARLNLPQVQQQLTTASRDFEVEERYRSLKNAISELNIPIEPNYTPEENDKH